eukprot:c30791_g1_i1 orf=17-166(+)
MYHGIKGCLKFPISGTAKTSGGTYHTQVYMCINHLYAYILFNAVSITFM